VPVDALVTALLQKYLSPILAIHSTYLKKEFYSKQQKAYLLTLGGFKPNNRTLHDLILKINLDE
jgi:hypothetical protein